MTLNDYQTKALLTDSYDASTSAKSITDPGYVAKILGLVGESGEVAEKYKKLIRNENGHISEADRKELLKEMGDVLWYVAVLTRYLGADFEEVATINLKKLADRKSRGAINSKGDNR